MSRRIRITFAATLALVCAQSPFAAEPAAAASACPADSKALAKLVKSLKLETKWDDPESPNPDFRHYKPGALRVLGLAPNDVFVGSSGGKPQQVSFRFAVRELQPLVPAFQAAYATAKCTSANGCAVDPRTGESRGGELVLAEIAPGSSEYLGATLSCRYRAD